MMLIWFSPEKTPDNDELIIAYGEIRGEYTEWENTKNYAIVQRMDQYDIDHFSTHMEQGYLHGFNWEIVPPNYYTNYMKIEKWAPLEPRKLKIEYK